MAHQWVRMNLASAEFPFLSDMWGRSILVGQYDTNYDKGATSSKDLNTEKGIPQAYYMHNCMPTHQGYQTIGYDTGLVAMLGAPNDFDAAFPIQNADLNRFIFVPANGKNYIFDSTLGNWRSISPIPTVSDATLVTTSYVQGQSYIGYQGIGVFTYDDVGKALTPVIFTGLVMTGIKGITTANGYMLAWDDTTISWSNLSVPTDFVPSLVTGAGGGSINQVKGRILFCLPIAGGFIVYAEQNCVAAQYTGNVRFPFIFTEITGSNGVLSPEQVSWQSNLGEHYCWSTSGLQRVTLTTSDNAHPEVTDFLAAKQFEDFDEATLTFSQQDLSSQLNVKVAVAADRFLVISYGVTLPDYTHALVMDLALKRWGKLKITHRDCFQWNAPTPFGIIKYGDLSQTTYGGLAQTTYAGLLSQVAAVQAPKKTLAFLQGNGVVKIVNFDLSEITANGVLMLGKFQFMRNKFITHQRSDIETVRTNNIFNFYIVNSLDGKTLAAPVAGTLITRSANSRRYGKRVSGQNISALMIGAFHATTYLMDFTLGGDR